MTFRHYLFILLLIFLFSNSKDKINAEKNFCDIYIINDQNVKVRIKAEIAHTLEAKTRGLMYRKVLEKNTGMLFIFDSEGIQNFWMKNTYIPLSIAYIGKNGIINEIYQMKPLDTSVTYPSRKPCSFALEVNKDWFRANKISEGCRIIFNGCFGKQN